jgi:hypothetical protein
MTIPTVRIQDPNKPGDYVVINESDFNAEVHKPFVDKQAKPTPAKADRTKNAPDAKPR